MSSMGTVACGGLATECVESKEGYVACGGLATDCLTSSAGRVACGGDIRSRQAYPPNMKWPMFQLQPPRNR